MVNCLFKNIIISTQRQCDKIDDIVAMLELYRAGGRKICFFHSSLLPGKGGENKLQ